MRPAALLRAAHREPVAGVTLIATALAAGAGRGALMTAVCGAAVLSGQLFVGWSNDLVDAGLDAAQQRADKPVASGQVSRRAVMFAAGSALVICLPLSLWAGLGSALAHFAAIAAASGYNLVLKRTPLSVVAYAFAFAMLPPFVTLGPPITHAPAAWAVGAGALAGAAAHFTQVLPDIERDLQAGVRGLPQILGARVSVLCAALLLVAAAALVAVGALSLPVLLAFAVTAGLMLITVAGVRRGRLEMGFRLTLISALLVVGALVLSGGRL